MSGLAKTNRKKGQKTRGLSVNVFWHKHYHSKDKRIWTQQKCVSNSLCLLSLNGLNFTKTKIYNWDKQKNVVFYGGRRKIYNTYYNKWIHQVMQILIETASKFAFRFDGGHFDQSQKVPSSIGIF